VVVKGSEQDGSECAAVRWDVVDIHPLGLGWIPRWELWFWLHSPDSYTRGHSAASILLRHDVRRGGYFVCQLCQLQIR
jgi:hypothetical protein